MTEATNTNGEAFVKVAVLAALHIQAVNSAIEAGETGALTASTEFGEKVSKAIMDSVPEDIAMDVMLELLGSVLGV